MEGLAGVDEWDQCYHPDDNAEAYQAGCRHLIAETNAAIAGFFDGGATEVFVVDGHGRNRGQVLRGGGVDPRARHVTIPATKPCRFEGFDQPIAAVAVIGQHAMAGTPTAFLDHTQSPKTICRFRINGAEHGELSQLAAYAGHHGCPLVLASGDEALCKEATRLFPWCETVTTKRGLSWGACELHPPDQVRYTLRAAAARGFRNRERMTAWVPELPAEISIEWAWSGLADLQCEIPGTRRVGAREVVWMVADARDILTIPFPEFGKDRPAPTWL